MHYICTTVSAARAAALYIFRDENCFDFEETEVE
jgi:hypothetical protein